MIALQALTPTGLTRILPGVAIEEARKVVSVVHRRGELPHLITGVRRVSMDALRQSGAEVPALSIHETHPSRIDPFVKFALATGQGELIETVRIPLEKPGRFSVCVSSQVGCALACSFCATGRMGLIRNLETWEIIDQVRIVRESLSRERGERVHGVVFQGMGEPLANVDRVLDAIAVLSDPCGPAIDARAITVCTSGLPTGIRRLAREAPRVRLGLSIASARPSTRRSLMPIDRAHPLDDVIAACVEHAQLTGLSPMWAVALLAGVNDYKEDALALADLVQSFKLKAGLSPRISILDYNPIAAQSEDPFTRTSPAHEARFRAILIEKGIGSHKRYSGGSDVRGACGQLAATL